MHFSTVDVVLWSVSVVAARKVLYDKKKVCKIHGFSQVWEGEFEGEEVVWD